MDQFLSNEHNKRGVNGLEQRPNATADAPAPSMPGVASTTTAKAAALCAPTAREEEVMDLDSAPPQPPRTTSRPPNPISIASEEEALQEAEERKNGDSDVEVVMGDERPAVATPIAGVKRTATDPMSPSKTAWPGASSSAGAARSAQAAEVGEDDCAQPYPNRPTAKSWRWCST